MWPKSKVCKKNRRTRVDGLVMISYFWFQSGSVLTLELNFETLTSRLSCPWLSKTRVLTLENPVWTQAVWPLMGPEACRNHNDSPWFFMLQRGPGCFLSAWRMGSHCGFGLCWWLHDSSDINSFDCQFQGTDFGPCGNYQFGWAPLAARHRNQTWLRTSHHSPLPAILHQLYPPVLWPSGP